MAHSVLILGNGFDIDLGYKTKYSDFVNSEYWPFKEKNLAAIGVPNLQNYIHDFTIKHKDELGNVRWIDIEELLRDYAISMNEFNLCNDEIVQADKEAYNLLVVKFGEYIRVAQRLGSKLHYVYKPSYKLVEAISLSSKTWKGFTFNYTDSEAIIDFMIYEKKGKRFQLPFFHIHGEVEMPYGESTLILGIDDVTIPKEYKFMRKSWNKNFNSHRLDDELVEAEQIVFFGLSFGHIDREYFRDFFNIIIKDYKPGNNRKELHIITYDEYSRLNIMENLEGLGVQMSRLKKAMDVNFYLTSEMSTAHEIDRYNELCRIIKGNND